MVFATTTRDLTVSAANRPRTAVQVEVCVIRTHRRITQHQTLRFPYSELQLTAICFLLRFDSASFENRRDHFDPRTKRFLKRKEIQPIFRRAYRSSWAERREEKFVRKKIRIDFFLGRVYRSREEMFSENFERKNWKSIHGWIDSREIHSIIINSCFLLI